MKKILLFTLLLNGLFLNAQTETTFENFGLATDEAINDAGMDGGFSAGNIFLPNSYNPNFNSWSGWAISASTDVTTPGFMNDLSAITGEGYDGSTTYAVSFATSGSIMKLTGPAMGGQVSGMYVTNGTYPYLSMLDGDGFAKKFGGETGDDPDFYLLTIKGFSGGQLTGDSVDFYLADYRFADNSQDYIVDEWTWVDLTSLGNIDSLQFNLSSTDVGMFGMNTPGYFCVDNVLTTDMPSSSQEFIPDDAFSLFPNPFVERLNVKWENATDATLRVKSLEGKTIFESNLMTGLNSFTMSHLISGTYITEIHSNEKIAGRIVIKK